MKVKVNNPSLYHNCESDPAQTFVQPAFSFEAATSYESNKFGRKWKKKYGPLCTRSLARKKIIHRIFPLRQGNIIVHQNQLYIP